MPVFLEFCMIRFPLALAHNVDIASSQAPIKSLQRKQVIPNLCTSSIQGTEGCALPCMHYTGKTREKSRMSALNISREISSKLLMHHPTFPLPIGNINCARPWKSISISKQLLARGQLRCFAVCSVSCHLARMKQA